MRLLLDTHAFLWDAMRPAGAATFHHVSRHEHRDPFDRMLAPPAIRNG